MKVTFNQIVYLIIFIVITMIVIDKNQKDTFINLCQSYNQNGLHCPHRVKYRNGQPTIEKPFMMDQNYNCQNEKQIASLYNSDLLLTNGLTNGLTNNCADNNQEESKQKQLEFIKFADKYPVAIKSKNTNLCGK
jgi:hypothetical protein